MAGRQIMADHSTARALAPAIRPPHGAEAERSAGGPKIVIYSHDTYGLGHLRRSRAIANRLVAANPGASVVIITGSPVVGSFDFAHGVDYVRVPGVVKLPDGDYTTLSLNLPLEQAVAIRKAIILETCRTLDPDLLIADKEPTGFRGELLPALEHLKSRGTRLVLGVRDVMDDPDFLVPEWQRKGALDALIHYYDDVWVYGLKDIYEPLAALPLPPEVAERVIYTGYLRREKPQRQPLTRYPKLTRGPFVLVTTGGGGDGEELIDWVIAAYEADRTIPLPALIVFGPFMPRESRSRFLERVARLPLVEALTFDAGLEHLMSIAAGVVCMGGYNTFCEILSFDRPALIVPRRSPRLEQAIRAERASRLGLISHLDGSYIEPGATRDPLMMAAAIRTLPTQGLPSKTVVPGLLDGLGRIEALTAGWLGGALPAVPRRIAGRGGAE